MSRAVLTPCARGGGAGGPGTIPAGPGILRILGLPWERKLEAARGPEGWGVPQEAPRGNGAPC